MNEGVNGLMNERMKNMKTIKVIGYGLWVMGMLLVGMPVMAQQQDWKSTSTMPRVGSSLAPTVQQVGAESVPIMATTTTDSYSPASTPTGPRKGFIDPSNPGSQSEEYPIGDAVLPLLLCAVAFALFVYFRRKQTLKG